jgi:UDP:flavonoid glycosyltransferase YjiC (YdhE family)
MIARQHSRTALALEASAIPRLPDSKTPRLLFIGEGISLAHVARPAVLGRWAREAGYDVAFACGPAYAAVARAEEFDPITLTTIIPETFHKRMAAGKFFYTSWELDGYVRAELEIIDRVQPDLVVGDFRLSLDVSTTLAAVPLLSLTNAHWSPVAACRFPPPRAGPLGFLPNALRNRLFDAIRFLVLRYFAVPLNLVRRRNGLQELHDFREHFCAGNWCAYLDAPDLYPKLRDGGNKILPAGHFFLGPVVWEPRNQCPLALEVLGSERPLVYVTLGSSGNTDALPDVLRTLVELDCSIALSGVDKAQEAALRRSIPVLEGRCVMAPLFDPRPVLEHARVTVCHGGSGTVYQSLAAGVPVLCLPGNPDQALVAAAAEEQGVGRTINPGDTSVDMLRSIRGVLATMIYCGRCTRAAREMSKVLALHDTRRRWLEFLSRFEPRGGLRRNQGRRGWPIWNGAGR